MKYLIILGIIIIAVIVLMVLKNQKIPSGLGVFEGRLAKLPSSPNAVSSQTDDPEKKVDPIAFKGDQAATLSRIKQVLNDMGNMTIISETSNYIHAISTTAKMKYHDDVEFYLDPKTSLVHFRSASRVGYSDMGMNKKRYNAIVTLYNKP